jgi:hypothetical protein
MITETFFIAETLYVHSEQKFRAKQNFHENQPGGCECHPSAFSGQPGKEQRIGLGDS